MLKTFAKKSKGFTLIELLVVIAIIGILSAIVLVSISGTRSKAYDAEVKSELTQVRNNAEAYYDTHNQDYTGYVPADNNLIGPTCSCAASPCYYDFDVSGDGQNYVTYSKLCSSDQYFCVDSVGFAGVISSAPTTTDCGGGASPTASPTPAGCSSSNCAACTSAGDCATANCTWTAPSGPCF